MGSLQLSGESYDPVAVGVGGTCPWPALIIFSAIYSLGEPGTQGFAIGVF